jgi:hypothetical protein
MITPHLLERIALVAVMMLFGSFTWAKAQSMSSAYTSLDAKQCKTLKSSSAEGGSYEARCKGVGGYVLLVSEGDLRQNVTVVTPSGKQHSLELWSVVSGGFSSVGPKAEWRAVKQNNKLVPVALIVRFNASEDPSNSNKITSYLAVAKITSREVCVTSKISPGAKANEEARVAADDAANKPCLKSQ